MQVVAVGVRMMTGCSLIEMLEVGVGRLLVDLEGRDGAGEERFGVRFLGEMA